VSLGNKVLAAIPLDNSVPKVKVKSTIGLLAISMRKELHLFMIISETILEGVQPKLRPVH